MRQSLRVCGRTHSQPYVGGDTVNHSKCWKEGAPISVEGEPKRVSRDKDLRRVPVLGMSLAAQAGSRWVLI